MRLARVLVALVLFGVGFGYVEAAVVVYLRQILEPARQEQLAGALPSAAQPRCPTEWADEVFPLLSSEQLQAAGPQYVRAVVTEMGRELATLLILTAVALVAARNVREGLAAFMVAFGVWDVFYYVFLRLLLGWPQSPWTWDVLFLWPTVWAGPVISPLLVAAGMIAAGVDILWREARGRPVRFAWFPCVLILLGALILIAAFCWDYQNMSAGGWPHPFNWPLFALGMALGAAGFVHAFLAKPDGRRSVGR
jgi:hypothetical protein